MLATKAGYSSRQSINATYIRDITCWIGKYLQYVTTQGCFHCSRLDFIASSQSEDERRIQASHAPISTHTMNGCGAK